MKHLELKNQNHIRLEKSFKEWLSLTGYAESSVYQLPNYTREFLHYLETNGKSLESTTAQDINAYFFHLKNRKKQRREGFLSSSFLNKHLQSICCFIRYLKETEQAYLETDIILPQAKPKLPEILTQEEIRQLYEACDTSPIGLRDRVMLTVYYGCGLRRNEGVSLDIPDFLTDKNLLYVRKGKNYKERYVPLTPEIKQDLQEYLDYGRSSQLKDFSNEAFFLSERGTRITGQSLMLRLKCLLSKAEITKDAGLHTLRHSIATHLLQSGMKLKNISKFLGHSSLESTQIYTHITNETV
jgi:integrase/recombinase XerD